MGAAPVLSWGSRQCSEPELISSAWRVSPDVVPARSVGAGWGHHDKAAQRIAWPVQSTRVRSSLASCGRSKGKGCLALHPNQASSVEELLRDDKPGGA